MLVNYFQTETQQETRQATADFPYLTLSYDLENYYPLFSHIKQDMDQRWILFIAPPGKPNISFLTQAGVHKSRIITLPQSKINNHSELLKSALKSHNYSTVITWLTNCDRILENEINALAAQSDCRCFIYCTQ